MRERAASRISITFITPALLLGLLFSSAISQRAFSRDALIGIAVGELAGMVTNAETRAGIQTLATRLLQPHSENLFAKSINAEGKIH